MILLNFGVVHFSGFTIAFRMYFRLCTIRISSRSCNLIVSPRFRIKLLVTHPFENLSLARLYFADYFLARQIILKINCSRNWLLLLT